MLKKTGKIYIIFPTVWLNLNVIVRRVNGKKKAPRENKGKVQSCQLAAAPPSFGMCV